MAAPPGRNYRASSRKDLKGQRRPRTHPCWDHLYCAVLWPLHGANLGTLLRTCDAVGACLAVPPWGWVDEALRRGDTLRHRSCVHRVGRPTEWLAQQQESGARILGVELMEGATRLADLAPARGRAVVVLGHEQTGIPPEAYPYLDEAVEIPMVGTGLSLNVAVAGSLVLYRAAGLL